MADIKKGDTVTARVFTKTATGVVTKIGRAAKHPGNTKITILVNGTEKVFPRCYLFPA